MLSRNFIIHEAFLKSCWKQDVTFSTLQESSTDTSLEAFSQDDDTSCVKRTYRLLQRRTKLTLSRWFFCWWHSFFKGAARFKQKCFYFLRLCSPRFFRSKSVCSSTHIEMNENDDGICVLFHTPALSFYGQK